MVDQSLIDRLQKQRSALKISYVVHVLWFAAMLTSAGLGITKVAVATSVLLTLLTVPPVLFYTVAVHNTSRILCPRASTVGLVPVILITIFFTPLESGLILPAKNLHASGRLLRRLQREIGEGHINPLGPNNSFKPKPLRGSA